VITALIPFAFQGAPMTLAFILKICWVYITVVVVRLLCTFLTSLYTISSEHEKLKERSMKGFYQMIKLVVICIGVIIIVSTLIDKDPVKILTGLGASAAILTLVFKDTIMGLVAGVQLTANDMLRPGDWITMPKYGADGTVLEVTLTTVKVQNWDKTISTIPPYALVNDSFQNWRGMRESGGRRVKRSINIDMHSVRFCTADEMDAYRREEWMQDFEGSGQEVVNLYVFRYYMERYLRTHPKVNQNLMIMIRQLQPTAEGMPIELYFFSDGTDWIPYEHLQAEVFDHLLATLHKFDLKVFQSPTGLDLRYLKS
jgi:miniconductance mechanosensitive channel